MAILILNQNYVQNGVGTLTYTVPSDGIYNVQVQVTAPSALATGDGAGSGTGLGSGAGGGAEGTIRGDFGLGFGGVGQGFGVGNGYQQPPAYGSNETMGSPVSSALVVVVNKNGSPIYTAPVLTPTQSSLEFKTSAPFAAADVITVVLSSSGAPDNQLNSVKSNISIGQGA